MTCANCGLLIHRLVGSATWIHSQTIDGFYRATYCSEYCKDLPKSLRAVPTELTSTSISTPLIEDQDIALIQAYRDSHEDCFDTSELGGEQAYWRDSRCDLCIEADLLLRRLKRQRREQNKKKEVKEKKIQTEKDRFQSAGRRVKS